MAAPGNGRPRGPGRFRYFAPGSEEGRAVEVKLGNRVLTARFLRVRRGEKKALLRVVDMPGRFEPDQPPAP